MSGTAHTKQDWRKKERSMQRTIERYQGKLVMIQTWEQVAEPDNFYLRRLRAEAQKLRAQLKVKGFIFTGEEI
jgi:hypothetical protein